MSTSRPRLSEEQLQRLRKGYTLPELAVRPGSPERDAEDQSIKNNLKLDLAKNPHEYSEGETVDEEGNLRCGLCGAARDQHMIDSTGKLPAETPQAASADLAEAAKLAQGIDAGVDQALVLLRSTPDLSQYAAQAQALLQGIEPACDELLEYFGVMDADDDVTDPQGETAVEKGWSITSVRDRAPQPMLARPAWLPSNTFVTEANGKTILTAKAFVDPGLFEKATTPHEHMLWMQGRFVGADTPNRNGALWTSKDLELGQVTVKHGPLNWLHDAKHVIGTIADAAFVTPSAEHAAEGVGPHIAAVSAIWRWIYPDEAEVIEFASENSQLWYSMECVSKAVNCVGENGCGATASYMDYIQGINGACAHMVQRSSTRHFEDPTFLGGAVIVPPVRPGWADADVAVMRQAASLTEKAYDDAGRPDMNAIEWEILMRQVLRFAGV